MINERDDIAKKLIKFSIPLILSGILQQMFNWADAFIVGNTVGESALAAVGATSAVSNMFIRVLTGLASGVTILIARYYGENRHDSINRALKILTACISGLYLILSAVGILMINRLLIIMGTPLDIFELSKTYLVIIFLGMPFLAVYNVISAVIRGVGDSRTPFVAVTVAGALNIALDYIFVAKFRMGVVGAAEATVLSQIFMMVFALIYGKKEHRDFFAGASLKNNDMDIVKESAHYSLPIAFQAFVKSLGNMLLQNFMNGFGTRTVAAITTAYRVDSVMIEPVLNLGTGVSILTSQSVGEKRPDKAKKYLLIGTNMMACIASLLTIFIMLMGKNMISMFGTTELVSGIGGHFFKSLSMFYVIYALSIGFRCFLEGNGDVIFTGGVVIGCLCVRIVLSYILKPVFGNMVIAYAEGISWVCMLVLYFARYLQKYDKNKSGK